MLFAILMCLFAAPAFAQEAPSLRAHHVTIGAGAVWSGSYGIGDRTAQLRGNGPGSSAPPFDWFSASSNMTSVFAPELYVGVAMTRTIAVDGGVVFAQPRIAYSISRDAEAGAQDLPGEQLDQYQIGAGVTWQLPSRLLSKAPSSISQKLAPFVSAGGAYLRQLHEDRGLAETGWNYYAGGGARYWLRGGHGASRALGVRADARINFRVNGIDFENKMRTYPTLAVSLFVGL